MNKIIAFIPARCGSKSIPMKNVKLLGNKPLIYWNLFQLQQSKNIDEIVVATDCIEISDIVSSFGFSKTKIYNRSKQHASDTSTTEDVMEEFIDSSNYSNEDLFMLVQATSPLTRTQDFDGGISMFLNGEKDSILSVVRHKRFFWTESGDAINYDYKSRPRRQDFPGYLMENGAFYISKIGEIIKSGNRLSGKVGCYEMPEYTALELDEEEDWIIAEAYLRKYVIQKKSEIKLLISDIDGVLTDSGMYYSENGDELKKFSTYDGYAFNFLMSKGIEVALITGEDRKLNQRRANKLGIKHVFHGIKDKVSVAKKLCASLNIDLDQVAFIGDDINDFELLSIVGLPACPKNAVSKIQNIPNIIKLEKSGGEGVVREFVDNHIN